MSEEKKEEIEYISKSQMKRDMLALQALGEKLVELTPQQVDQIELPEDLAAAISQAQAIKKHGARRRQLQYIGKLMRSIDADAIQLQLDKITRHSAESISQHHQMEKWREKLLENEEGTFTEFVNAYPDVDRQQLRTLIRSAIQERHHNKPPKFFRKLFQFIKQYVEAAN